MNKNERITIQLNDEYVEVTYLGNDPKDKDRIIVKIGYDSCFYVDPEKGSMSSSKIISIPKSSVIY